ncbi:PPE family protein [Mycobacterium servetii]|uniref:PPE family protein n=1 Tax=Mycobacterium servetii TaxID=3237418 RepID=A0ABV4BXT3_9MYCO
MDFGALPPEINSARMYAGPGAGPMLAAASAWHGVAAEMRSAASSYEFVISELSTGWLGPSAATMTAAVTPYLAWMNATAGQAELTAVQAQAAANAYEQAFAMTVPPPVVAANRAQLMMLLATNFFGQNAPAIAANEAQYAEMWAQDAAAMYGYAAHSAAATAQVTPFGAAPQTTNASGLAAQGAATAQNAGAASGTGVQSALSHVVSSIPTTLQGLASPLSVPASAAGTTSAASVNPITGIVSSSSLQTIGTTLLSEYLYLPGFAGLLLSTSALGPLMNPDVFLPFMNMGAAAAGPAAALPGAAAAEGALGAGAAGGWGGLAGLGQAASLGGLSVPPSWGWAATAPEGMLGSVPLMHMMEPAAASVAGADLGAGSSFPFMFSPLGRAATMGAAAGAGAGAAAVVAKYGPRLKVLSRSPAAGYSEEAAAAPAASKAPKYPVPASFPSNGHAPPGYQPAIVYVPINGNAPTNV